MNKYEFTVHYLENINFGIAFFIASLCATFLILRKHIYSIFDPLFFMSILASAAYSVVFYLHHFDLIEKNYFYSFIFTQIAFFIGFLLNKNVSEGNFSPLNYPSTFTGPIYFLYPMAVILYFTSQLFVYHISGIPLFMESRLETFSGGSGYGFLSRIIYVASIITISISFYRMIYLKNRLFYKFADIIIFIIAIIFSALSGSKAALLMMIFICFFVTFYARKLSSDRRAEIGAIRLFKFIVILSIPAALITILIQTGYDSIDDIFISLLMRFINTGDAYYMSYPDGILNQLTPANSALALFKDPLGSLRIADWNELPVNLGLQIFWYHYNTDMISGPNSRHNIFGLFYFGFYYSILYSFILGFLTSLIRNMLYKKLPRNMTGMIIYISFAYTAMYIEQDFSGLAMGYFFSIILIFPCLYFLALTLSNVSTKFK